MKTNTGKYTTRTKDRPMGSVLMFWKERQPLVLSPAEVCRELVWGEDVDGLVDLPVKEILDRLKGAFPRHRETPGLVVVQPAAGYCEATWTWQHVRLQCHDVSPADRERLIEILAEFGCQPYEAE
jgi:hypothetical protein